MKLKKKVQLIEVNSKEANDLLKQFADNGIKVINVLIRDRGITDSICIVYETYNK